MSNDFLCQHCEHDRLQVTSFDEVIQFRGEEILVPGLQGFKCLECGEFTLSPAQIRANQAIYAEKKAEAANRARSRVGMLAGNEIRQLREEIGLTQVQFARALGCAPMTFSKYERGEVIQSAAVDVLLQMIQALPGATAFIRERAGMPESVTWAPVKEVTAPQCAATAERFIGVTYLDSKRKSVERGEDMWRPVSAERCG